MTDNGQLTTNTDRALAAVSCAGQEGEGLKEITISPWGRVESRKGSFVMDGSAARAIVADFERAGNTLPIDWEHQTLGDKYASPTGVAPAAGWIEKLWAVPGVGLKALVKWTDKAREAIRSDAYRYSPASWLNEQMKAGGVKLEGGKLSEKEFATVEGLERLILSQAETARLNRDAAELNKRAAELQAAHPPVTNHYHNQFSRNTYPDHQSQRRNIRNGETLARSLERL